MSGLKVPREEITTPKGVEYQGNGIRSRSRHRIKTQSPYYMFNTIRRYPNCRSCNQGLYPRLFTLIRSLSLSLSLPLSLSPSLPLFFHILSIINQSSRCSSEAVLRPSLPSRSLNTKKNVTHRLIYNM